MASTAAVAALVAVALAVTGSAAADTHNAVAPARVTPSFVQGGYGYADHGTAVTFTLPKPVGAGHLLAVHAVWSNTGSVHVTDNRQDTFASASARSTWAGGYSSSVFYAPTAAGGTTTVQATLGSPVSFAVLYVDEYAGVDNARPVDAHASSVGRGAQLASGALRTTSARDLVFAAGASDGTVSAGGNGYRVRSFGEGNVVEDTVTGDPGTYTATATHGGGSWVMQAVAFRGAPKGSHPATSAAPSPTSSAPTSAPTTGTTTSAAPSTSSTSTTAAPASSSTTPPASTTPVAGTCTYPRPSCTGVPAGTTFTKTVTGDYTAKTPGEIIDGWHITGTLLIGASNVTVRNTQIDNYIENQIGSTDYGPFSVTDSTVGPAQGCNGGIGIGESDFTATRVLVRGHEDGFRMSGNNITVQDSYALLCYLTPAQDPPDGSHSDGIQAYCPDTACSNLLFKHNTIDAAQVPSTNAVNATDPKLSGVTVQDNLLMGGAYTIDAWYHSGPAWVFTNNRLVNGKWSYGPASAEGTCSNQSWSGNTLVTADSNYNVTGTVGQLPCVN